MSKVLEALELIKNYDIEDTNNGIKVIDKSTKLELPDGLDKDRIIAKIEMIATIGQYSIFERHTDGLKELFNNDTTFYDEQYDKLKQFILQTFRTGNTVIANNEYQSHDIGKHFLNKMGGFGFYDNSLDANSRKELRLSKTLINYILNSNGLKLTDFKIEVQGQDQPEKISWTTEKLSLKESLDPNNPQYAQATKPKKLSPEGQAKKRAFAEELITYYKMMESDTAYADRVEKEEANMKAVADTVNMSKSIDRVTSGRGLMNRLMAAQNLSLNGEKDYLEYLISQPGVSDALLEIKKSGRFEQIKQEAELNKANGKVRDGRVRGHFETMGERCRRLANSAISRNPNTVSEIKRYLSTTSQTTFSKDDEVTAYIFSAVARTMGNTPSIKDNNDGNITFNSDSGITK